MGDTLNNILESRVEDKVTNTVNNDSNEEDCDSESSDDNTQFLKDLFSSSDSYKLVDKHFSMKNDSNIFVVLQDDIPQFYVNNLIEARKHMWTLARLYKLTWFKNHSSYIKESGDENQITLMGTYRFFLVSYDRPISYFEISEIKEVNNN